MTQGVANGELRGDPCLNLRQVLRNSVAVRAPKVISAATSASAAAGAQAYAQGGNAFDAALAACFMDTITLPMKCGLAGDLVALIRRAGGPFEALVSVGAGPLALAAGGRMERVGPRSVGVPGAPQGFAKLHEFARLELEQLTAPAIAAAAMGVPWTGAALSYLVEAKGLLATYSPGHPYAPGGRMPAVGELRILPGLGRWLALFARHREALFETEAGAALLAALTPRGGLLSAADFRQRPARMLVPASGDVAPGLRLSATPLPTHGPRLISTVATVLAGSSDPVTAVRGARADARRAGLEPSDGGTTLVIAADDAGNVAVVLHSNSFPQFASGIVLDDGLILNNRPGRGFDLTAPPGAANAPAAGKVPWTTVHAWALETDGQTFVGATPGGVNQMPWNVQSVLALAAGEDPAGVVTAPRWALDAQDVLSAEPGALPEGILPDKSLEELELRSVQQVAALSGDGGLHELAADPRTGGRAIGLYGGRAP